MSTGLRKRTISMSREESEVSCRLLFTKFDKDGDNLLTRDEFIEGLESLGDLIDLSSLEAGRLYDKLDSAGLGSVDMSAFQKACMEMRWLRTLSKLFSAVESHIFDVKADYDYSKTTCDNYATLEKEYVGDYAEIRASRDYSYHSNYCKERQRWQDFAVKCCLGKTEAHARPWIIYTCGPMGVGKGHVLSWLSKRGLFPVEYIAHIDPDFFKRIMPEWSKYVSVNREFAGTACHKESGYLQEIAQEVAMRERQHIWVDGSLSDGDWFQNIFEDIRKRFPHYRIAIFYISASEPTIRARIAKRTAETGRAIPESQVLRSLRSPEDSLKKLAPLTDIVARIWNENAIQLKCVEDYSGNWFRGLGRLFNAVETEELKFPHSLSTLYLEKTSLRGEPFSAVLDRTRNDKRLTHLNGKWDADDSDDDGNGGIIKQGYLDKEGKYRKGMKRRYFVLRPGCLSYYNDKDDIDLKGAFSLCGNFELLPNIESTNANDPVCCSGPPVPRRLSSSPAGALLTAVKGALNPAAAAMKRTESLDRDTGFYVRGFHTDGTGYSLAILAPSPATKSEWITAISTEIARIKGVEHSPIAVELDTLKMTPKETISLEFTAASLVASPNLRVMATRLHPICIEASPIFKWTSKECDTHTVTGAPPDTTHFRFLFPSQQVQSMMHRSLVTGVEDPDILLLLFGGFAYLDADGNVLGVMAISETPSQQCLTFGPPEHLPPPDVLKLAAASRWAEVRIPHMLSSGVKYFTYILPSETLETSKKYPANGSLAFLFREPKEHSDPRDCCFGILYDY